MIIYKITNLINGKLYIGLTKYTAKRRFKEHCKPSSNMLIGKSIQKYGKHNFTIEVLEQVNDLDLLNWLEAYYIKHFDCLAPIGYNLHSGGNNHTILPETKLKLSLSRKGQRNSPATEFKKGPRPELKGKGNPMYGKLGFFSKKVMYIPTGIIYPSIKHLADDLGITRSYASLLLSGNRTGDKIKACDLTYVYEGK
jgi:group I intron endonuclease